MNGTTRPSGFKMPQQDGCAEDFEVVELEGEPIFAADLHQDIFLLAWDSETPISLIDHLEPKVVEQVLKGSWNKNCFLVFGWSETFQPSSLV